MSNSWVISLQVGILFFQLNKSEGGKGKWTKVNFTSCPVSAFTSQWRSCLKGFCPTCLSSFLAKWSTLQKRGEDQSHFLFLYPQTPAGTRRIEESLEAAAAPACGPRKELSGIRITSKPSPSFFRT